jgi:nucleotide-binding universal stress UspA family protein
VVIIPKGCDPVPGPAERGGIVVGVDGSRQADVALGWAAREAIARKADLDVVMAAWTSTVFPSRTPYPGSLTAALKDEAERIVTSALERLGPTEARLQTHVIEGQPAQVLLKEAEGRQLLVVGSRGLGRAREAFTGSVGHACAHHSTTPIAIVPSH